MNSITGVATKFTYQGKLELRIDKAQYDRLFDQFRYYLCRNFNRPPPCLVRSEHGTRQYYIFLTLNKLDRKSDYQSLIGQQVRVRYKLRSYEIKNVRGLVARLIDIHCVRDAS